MHAVSNFIGLIPFRSIRQMGVNFPGFKLEKSVPNIRRRKSLSCVHVPHKTQIETFSVVFVLRIRRQLNSVLTRGGGVFLQENLWYSPPASMTSRLASVTFKMASKVFIQETDKNSILSRKYRSDFLDLEILRFLLS